MRQQRRLDLSHISRNDGGCGTGEEIAELVREGDVFRAFSWAEAPRNGGHTLMEARTMDRAAAASVIEGVAPILVIS